MEFLEIFTHPSAWGALLALIAMELVLGIDNLIFISIFASKLPPHQQHKARMIGLSLAVVMRLGLLTMIGWIVTLTNPIFTLNAIGVDHAVSARDLILFLGGAFLIWKATKEIHHKMEGQSEDNSVSNAVQMTFASAITWIIALDLVFSIDSIITAVGMVKEVEIMMVAVVVSVGAMIVAAKPLSEFVNRHPTVVMLALTFLVMIGMTLIAESMHFHVPKAYVYFAMGFSVLVELINMRARKKAVVKVQ